MITVECKGLNHASALFHKLTKAEKQYHLKVRKDEHRLYIHTKANQAAFQNKTLPFLADVFAEYVIETEEENRILHLIEQTFYFHDLDEQEQILVVAKSILEGEKTDLPKLSQVRPRKRVIAEAFSNFITPDIRFCYESFLQFRLKAYHDCLLQYVEIAIDEYKLEQEYQTFVENLRALVKRRKPFFDTIHVVHNKTFALYDDYYDILDDEQVFERIDPFIKNRMGVEIEPSVLVTLIGIAPKRIFLYSDQIDTGMIQTIQNVFQERVVLYPRRMFTKNHKGLMSSMKTKATKNSP